MVSLMKGFAGKPEHPSLTDVGIGAYTLPASRCSWRMRPDSKRP